MRVMKKYNSVPDNSCDPNSSFGQAEDYTVEVGGGGGAGGETCDAPIAVTSLPYDDAGNTADYGNNYSSGDVPPVATGAVTTGTGSTSYLNGDDVVYAYTPADDEVLNISTTNDDDWIGLWAFTGCPFTSTVGYHTATGGSTRSIEGLPVTAGETYYFVISTWPSPQSTDYTIHIESVGGDPDPSAYCIPEGTNSARYIDNFSTTGGTQDVSNMGSGFSPDGYGDFYDTHNVAQAHGEDATFEVDIEGGTAGFRIWVDWNQDGVFDTTEEVAYASSGYSADHTGSFTVPADALEGDTRMRIVSHWLSTSGDIDPCETGFTYGEFEDYKFTVGTGGGMVYCIPEGTNSARYIDNFSTTGGTQDVSNMGSGFSPDGYGDFYDTYTVAQEQGEDVAFEVDIEGGTAGFRIWVDWNQDGVFDTTEEVAYASTSYSADHTGSFTVPADALVGDTRMRIVSHWLSTTGDVDPCETGFTYGEFEDYKFTVEEGSGGGGGTACEQVFYDAVQPTGVGFSSGNAVANDITVAAGESFTMETMTFDVVNIAGLPSEFDLEIYEDNGSGGVGTTTGMTYHFDSSNMTFVENGTFSIYTQYTVTLTLPNIELTADASEDARYWLAIAADLTTTGDFTYWVSYDYVTNPDSYPSWQYNDTDGWFVYDGGSSEGIMTVSGICDSGSGGAGCEWTVIVEDTSWGDEVEWELREDGGGNILLSGGGYGNGYYDEQTVTAEGPLEFWITNDGFFGDNTPTYSVSNGTEVLVSGTLTTAETLTFSDLNCDGGTAGQTCDDAITVTDLPYTDAGNTADYGNFYSNGDVPDLAPDAVTNGTGSPFYLSGDEVVYAYTPADDEVLNISTTNDDDWIGLWAFVGCPFSSTVGYHTSINGDTRLIEELPVTAGETYYFVISTWAPPESTDYTILIERVGGTPPGGDCSLATEGVFENGKSFTKNLDRVVANDIVVPAGQNMLLEKINLNAFIGGVGSGVTAADVDVYVYEDNSGMPGALVTMIPDVVPTSQTIIGDAFGFQAYDVEIDFAAVNLPGQESAETTYWIGASLDATDGSNVFWEFYSNATAPVVGHGIAYDDGIVGFIIESDNEGVYTFHATCSDIGGGGSDCISTLYSGGNNGSPGGAVYFDVTVDSEDIELTSIDLNIDGAGTGFTVDVYTIEGTHVGNETNQGAWTMRTSGSGTSAGEGSPSTATLDDTFVLSANTTYGIALVLDGTHSHYYTNGDGTNEHFENADIALDLGAATNTPFSGTVFTPRVFNGGLCYNVGGGGTGDDCDQGDDSNGFENGYNITAGGSFRNADDFIVSAGNTLNVRSIVLNVFANELVSSVNINFFEDDEI